MQNPFQGSQNPFEAIQTPFEGFQNAVQTIQNGVKIDRCWKLLFINSINIVCDCSRNDAECSRRDSDSSPCVGDDSQGDANHGRKACDYLLDDLENGLPDQECSLVGANHSHRIRDHSRREENHSPDAGECSHGCKEESFGRAKRTTNRCYRRRKLLLQGEQCGGALPNLINAKRGQEKRG